MEIGRCPSCGRPFSSAEVTGVGILRPRPEHLGGPTLEFACPRCAHRMRLIPHGRGRYAFPGRPPPPPVPDEERIPSWARNQASRGGSAPDAEPYEIPVPPEGWGPGTAEPPPAAEAPPSADPEAVLTPAEARTILGVETDAEPEEIQRAFRARSRTCHPDKVSHLDAEFVELAERKFLRLKAAYDLLCSG
jgi:hypothetical protein